MPEGEVEMGSTSTMSTSTSGENVGIGELDRRGVGERWMFELFERSVWIVIEGGGGGGVG